MIVVALLALENLCLFYIADFYYQNKQYREIVKGKEGLIMACDSLTISDDLLNVVQKLKNYYPSVQILSGDIMLNYGTLRYDGPTTALLFDKNYKLINKSCSSGWEPELSSFTIK